MTEIENFFIYWPGMHNFRSGKHFQQNYHRESHRAVFHLGQGQGVCKSLTFETEKGK